MKNPLNKRLLRELRSDSGKYVVIFLLMVLTIGIVSGFLVADNSMILAYQESFEKYQIEDGHFSVLYPLNQERRELVASTGVSLYRNFYVDQKLDTGSTLRLFAMRDQVNLACLMEGSFPEAPGEIAIDRMYADNNHLHVGDTVKPEDPLSSASADGFTITGLVALSDYSTMFESNTDSMFDSIQFGVAVVSEEEFSSFKEEKKTFCYAWKYVETPQDETEEKEWADQLLETIAGKLPLTEYIPRYQNQAIQFTGDDMGGDRIMMIVFLYIVIVILAFVFAVTINNTITKEAAVIGTLRASGYTRRELIHHYMAMPLIITLISALVGNILGYTWLKKVCADLYYDSYSLPAYHTVWNAEAFWLTTIVPLILMVVVDYLILSKKLRLPPLKFIRRDLNARRQKKAFPLNHRIPIFGRFRIRVIFQNLSNYLILFIGILFANVLLLFGLLLPSVLNHFQDTVTDNLFSNYQYILQVPIDLLSDDKLKTLANLLEYKINVRTDNPDAEPFSAYSLKLSAENRKLSEEILFYGIAPDSRYLDLTLSPEDVFVSAAYADKYQIDAGDEITLQEVYEKKEYTFTVTGIYDYYGSLSVFMDQEALNKAFGLGSGTFVGYFSDTPITDIDEKYIGSVIDVESLTKISRQLNVSMGSMMYIVDIFSVIMFMVLIYLLSKIIIEKNAHSISMVKILGYSNQEISKLYILPTSILVCVFLLITMPLCTWMLKWIYKSYMLTEMNGYLPIYLDPKNYMIAGLLGFCTYLLVAVLEYWKIKKVPMDEALKTAE